VWRRVAEAVGLALVLTALPLAGAGGANALDAGNVSLPGHMLQDCGCAPYSSKPTFVAVAPDGTAWSTLVKVSKLVRTTAGGQVSYVDVPEGNSGVASPLGLVAGPDGAMWFSDLDNNRIGRATLAGALKLFELPNADSQPTGITTGPDANLWFTGFNDEALARLTPAGVFTEFPFGANAKPSSIATVGSKLVVVPGRLSEIDMMATDGTFTPQDLSGSPLFAAADPAGAWPGWRPRATTR